MQEVGMTGQPGDDVVQAWNDHRPYLVDLAFRMLGDIGAAEDVVQDAFTRLLRTRPGEIEDARGWLIVVTSRLCLDQIRSAHSRRERPYDGGEIEFVPGAAGVQVAGGHGSAALADPADRVTLDDNVSLALLVMLQRLGPAERVVFVLHDVFQVPFDAIAQTVGRSAATCRQLASRARRKIESGVAVREDVTSAEHRQVTERFIAACANGDLNGLLQVLAPDAWGDFDAGPGGPRVPGVVRGAVRVARHLLHYWGPGSTLVSHPVGGQPALLGFADRRLTGVLVLTMRGDVIQAVHVIADPNKLSFLSSQLG
jgi:RNA polymerase sigma-70 factor (ECF subfamily)